MFFAVRLQRGGPWDWSRDLRHQDGWDEHAAYMDELVEQGVIVLGGPLAGDREILHLMIPRRFRAGGPRPVGEGQLGGQRDADITSIEPWTILLDGLGARDADGG